MLEQNHASIAGLSKHPPLGLSYAATSLCFSQAESTHIAYFTDSPG